MPESSRAIHAFSLVVAGPASHFDRIVEKALVEGYRRGCTMGMERLTHHSYVCPEVERASMEALPHLFHAT